MAAKHQQEALSLFFVDCLFFFNLSNIPTQYTCCMLYVLQVLQHVRLPLLSPKFLVGTVGSDPLIKSDEECR